MKAYNFVDEHKRNRLIAQLEKYNYTDVEHKSIKELERCLIDAKALYVNVNADANKFF